MSISENINHFSIFQKMRKIYGQRRQVLLESLDEVFGKDWVAFGDAAGLHVAIDFPGMNFDEAFHNKCMQNGLYIAPVENHCLERGRHQSMLLIGYGHLEPDAIKKGVVILSAIINGVL